MIEQIITSSILIAFVLIFSFVMEKRVNPCLKYALWLLVAVKLLIPLPEFQSNISVMNLANQIEGNGVHYLFIDNAIDEAGKIDGDSGWVPAYSRTEDGEKTSGRMLQGIEIADMCCFVWIAGMLVCTGIFMWSNLRFFRRVRNSRVSVGKYKDKLNVYTTADVTGPCLFGLFRPSVYLQKNRELSKEQSAYVLAHEYIHYRHGDHVWAVVRCICVILYWYNPFVWLAACASVKDSELACDRGTLKLVGKENYKEYGKALIELAKGMSDKYAKYHVLGCPTSATGGGKEMKKRMRMITKQPRTKLISLLTVLLVCISMVGCTFSGAVDHADAKEGTAGKDHTVAFNEGETKIDEGQNSGKVKTENMTQKEGVLHRQPEADQVCIRVEPSVLRDQLFYYYIPTDKDQEWLLNRVKALNLKGEPFDGRWEGKKEKGWEIFYNDTEYRVFEGGYLYYTYTDESDIMECLVEDPQLCDYIQIMLQEKLDYYQFDVAKIRDIRSAKLEVRSLSTDWEYYSQTITDEETLKEFENWFGNAKYIYGGAGCANECACLELALAGGEVVRLSVATDSCPNFGINGIYYDYRPIAVWDNRNFFKCFDEIPWTWDAD